MRQELSESGKKKSITNLNNSGTLYIFENKEGKRYAFDGINAFARLIKTDAGNLYRTFTHKTYWCKGWRLIDYISLINPDWKDIAKRTKSCTIIERIQQKLAAIERELLSVRQYGRRLWKKIVDVRDTFTDYVNEKMQEPTDEPYKRKSYSEMNTSDYEDMCQRNLRSYEDSMMPI